MAGIIGNNVVCQVAFVVKDIEVTKKKFAEFLGVEPPDHFLAISPDTMVEGEPSPEAGAWLAFFEVGPGLSLELIQPNGVKSTWQDVLDQKGEGFHHIALDVKGKTLNEGIIDCENWGMKLVQRGKGYAYVDATEDLKCILEIFGK